MFYYKIGYSVRIETASRRREDVYFMHFSFASIPSRDSRVAAFRSRLYFWRNSGGESSSRFAIREVCSIFFFFFKSCVFFVEFSRAFTRLLDESTC